MYHILIVENRNNLLIKMKRFQLELLKPIMIHKAQCRIVYLGAKQRIQLSNIGGDPSVKR